MVERSKVTKFFQESKKEDGTSVFETKRQASKYLNHYGKVWKLEHNIPLSAPKRKVG